MSGWPFFTENQWSIVCESLAQVHNLTLKNIKCFIKSFTNTGTKFFDDLNKMKIIAMRKTFGDCESIQLCQMAQQVFLLENQRICNDEKSQNENENILFSGEQKSFTLIIEEEENFIR